MREETFICSICGHEHPIGYMTYFDGQDLCPDCLESRTCTCDRCGERIWRDDDHGEDSLTLCAHCAEAYYDHCSDCPAKSLFSFYYPHILPMSQTICEKAF